MPYVSVTYLLRRCVSCSVPDDAVLCRNSDVLSGTVAGTVSQRWRARRLEVMSSLQRYIRHHHYHCHTASILICLMRNTRFWVSHLNIYQRMSVVLCFTDVSICNSASTCLWLFSRLIRIKRLSELRLYTLVRNQIKDFSGFLLLWPQRRTENCGQHQLWIRKNGLQHMADLFEQDNLRKTKREIKLKYNLSTCIQIVST